MSPGLGDVLGFPPLLAFLMVHTSRLVTYLAMCVLLMSPVIFGTWARRCRQPSEDFFFFFASCLRAPRVCHLLSLPHRRSLSPHPLLACCKESDQCGGVERVAMRQPVGRAHMTWVSHFFIDGEAHDRMYLRRHSFQGHVSRLCPTNEISITVPVAPLSSYTSPDGDDESVQPQPSAATTRQCTISPARRGTTTDASSVTPPPPTTSTTSGTG